MADDAPPYCCAILRDPSGELLLEWRPVSAAVAAGKLTCFGGKREAGETAEACLMRELREELDWSPAAAPRRVVDLFVEGRLIAYFYEAAAPRSDEPLRLEAGREAVRLQPAAALRDDRLSEWHAAVLRAWQRGASRADFPGAAHADEAVAADEVGPPPPNYWMDRAASRRRPGGTGGSPPAPRNLLERATADEERRAQLRAAAATCSLATGLSWRVGKKDEDMVAVVPRFTGRAGDDFVGVFDGHRGECMACHAAATLHADLAAALAGAAEADVPAALYSAFARCHEAGRALELRDGCAALVFVALGESGFVANAGDCRAVLCRADGEAQRVSRDHKPADADETARVEAAGGTVRWSCLEGTLAMSRGLGDFDFGCAFSQRPHVQRVALCDAANRFLVCASDGVWDVFTDAQACELVAAALDAGSPLDDACDELLRQASARGSRDDKSVAIVAFPGAAGSAAGAGAKPPDRT
jgi:serine/threonine protein phosphatase PrpC/8-oxo-dGTP pyrophosphatase MutT (NUDIX family)